MPRFFRIHGASLTIPPLRMRNDRLELAHKLLALLSSEKNIVLGEDAAEWIEQHAWPDNVRELKSALVHAMALISDDHVIRRKDFPEVLLAHAAGGGGGTREEIFRTAAEEAVRACDGNLSEAARRLGVARSTLYRTLRRKPPAS